jgi:hypothetical protein
MIPWSLLLLIPAKKLRENRSTTAQWIFFLFALPKLSQIDVVPSRELSMTCFVDDFVGGGVVSNCDAAPVSLFKGYVLAKIASSALFLMRPFKITPSTIPRSLIVTIVVRPYRYGYRRFSNAKAKSGLGWETEGFFWMKE